MCCSMRLLPRTTGVEPTSRAVTGDHGANETMALGVLREGDAVSFFGAYQVAAQSPQRLSSTQ